MTNHPAPSEEFAVVPLSSGPEGEVDLRVASHVLALTLLLGLLVGCGEGDRPLLGEPLVHDSAGVIIQEFSGAVLDEVAPFQLKAEPAVRIGAVEGAAEYQWTRPVAGVRFPDGRFAILEAIPAELRIFDAEGTFVRRIGRPGGGPGEFQAPSGVAVLPGDTLLVWDSQPQRLSWFSSGGALERERSLREPGRIQTIRRLTPGPGGGAVLLGPTASMEDLENRGRVRENWSVIALTPEGEVGASMGTVPGSEREIRVQRSGPGEDGIISIDVLGRSWWGEGFAWPTGRGVWTADRLQLEVRRFDVERGLDRVLRVRAPDRPFTRALIDSLHALELAAMEDPQFRQRLRSDFQLREYPQGVPPVEAIFADAAGRVWIGLTELPFVRLSPRGFPGIRGWMVFEEDPEGAFRPLGKVTLPPLSHPLWGDGEGILLVRNDEVLGVGYVEWYRFQE